MTDEWASSGGELEVTPAMVSVYLFCAGRNKSAAPGGLLAVVVAGVGEGEGEGEGGAW